MHTGDKFSSVFFFFSLFLLVVAFYSWQQPLDEAIINGANRQYASCAIQIAQKNNQWTEYEKAVILSRITDLFAAINLDYWRVDAFIDSTLVGIDGSKNEKKNPVKVHQLWTKQFTVYHHVNVNEWTWEFRMNERIKLKNSFELEFIWTAHFMNKPQQFIHSIKPIQTIFVSGLLQVPPFNLKPLMHNSNGR